MGPAWTESKGSLLGPFPHPASMKPTDRECDVPHDATTLDGYAECCYLPA